MDIIVRNVEPYTAEKLNEMARKRRISRNDLIRRYLNTYAVQEDLIDIESKYENLVQVLADLLEHSSDLIEQNTEILQKCYEILCEMGE